jgi:hypothetical protein
MDPHPYRRAGDGFVARAGAGFAIRYRAAASASAGCPAFVSS